MYKKEVFTTWALVLQLGISIMVPLFLLVAIALLVKSKFGVDLVLASVVLGAIVGVRNVYVILKNYLSTMKNSEESELMKKHRKSFK